MTCLRDIRQNRSNAQQLGSVKLLRTGGVRPNSRRSVIFLYSFSSSHTANLFPQPCFVKPFTHLFCLLCSQYKIKGRSVSSSLAQASSTTASFPSLSKSTPSPVPSSTSTSGTINILSYFVIPKRVRLSGAASSRKRQRDDTTSLSSSSATKRRNVETDAAADAS